MVWRSTPQHRAAWEALTSVQFLFGPKVSFEPLLRCPVCHGPKHQRKEGHKKHGYELLQRTVWQWAVERATTTIAILILLARPSTYLYRDVKGEGRERGETGGAE